MGFTVGQSYYPTLGTWQNFHPGQDVPSNAVYDSDSENAEYDSDSEQPNDNPRSYETWRFGQDQDGHTTYSHVQQTSPFGSPESAANHFLDRATPPSIAENVEYGGNLYAREHASEPGAEPHRSYGYTGPETQNLHGGFVYTDPRVRIPHNTLYAGNVHTHGDYSDFQGNRTDQEHDERDSNRFSREDFRVARDTERRSNDNPDLIAQSYGGYPAEQLVFAMGGPGGNREFYNPHNHQTPREDVIRSRQQDGTVIETVYRRYYR